jgi:hypothetical protein
MAATKVNEQQIDVRLFTTAKWAAAAILGPGMYRGGILKKFKIFSDQLFHFI